MGVYGYADDISLLCPTVSGMKEMLKTCETYTDLYKSYGAIGEVNFTQ